MVGDQLGVGKYLAWDFSDECPRSSLIEAQMETPTPPRPNPAP
jgi:hypothetical protein